MLLYFFWNKSIQNANAHFSLQYTFAKCIVFFPIFPQGSHMVLRAIYIGVVVLHYCVTSSLVDMA